MIPALALVWVGSGRRVPLPIPLFLLWPLLGIGYLLVTLGRFLTPRGSEARGQADAASGLAGILLRLSGLSIDVRPRRGRRVRFRLI